MSEEYKKDIDKILNYHTSDADKCKKLLRRTKREIDIISKKYMEPKIVEVHGKKVILRHLFKEGKSYDGWLEEVMMTIGYRQQDVGRLSI